MSFRLKVCDSGAVKIPHNVFYV